MKKFYPLLFCIIIFYNGKIQAQIDSLELLLKKNIAETERIMILAELSKQYQNVDIQKAENYLNTAESLAKQINFKKGLCHCDNNRGNLWYKKAEFSNALALYKNAEVCFKELGDIDMEQKVLLNLASCYDKLGDYEQSFNLYLSNLKSIESSGNKENLYHAILDVGNFNLRHNRKESAKKYLFKALELAQDLQEPKFVARCLNNIGNVFYDEENFKEAVKYFNKALEMNTKLGNKRNTAFNFGSLGNVYMSSNQFPKSLEMFTKSKKIFEEFGEKRQVLIANYSLGNVYLKMKNYNASLELLNLAKSQAEEIKEESIKGMVLKKISEAYSGKEEYYLAYQNILVQDSIESRSEIEKKLALIEELERKYETEKKDKELALLKEEQISHRLEDAEQSKKFNQLLLGFVLLVGGGVFMGSKLRHKEKMANLLEALVAEKTMELREKNQQMVILLKEVHHRVKNNLQLISSLLNLQLFYSPDISSEALAENWKKKIKCLALVYDRLESSDKLDGISTGEYFNELTSNITGFFDSATFSLDKKIENHNVGIEKMVPCGLIFNELLINALKHNSLTDSALAIKISFIKKNDFYFLSISDTGKGLPAGFDFRTADTLGLSLIHDLSEQLDGNISWSNDNGLTVELKFPV
jgi:two-component system, sensor histidine kinase PdtaS